MLADSDRLLHTIDQVLRAGSAGSMWRRSARATLDLGEVTRGCVELSRMRFHLDPASLEYEQRTGDGKALVLGDPEELKAAILNLIDNAIKYSTGEPRVRVVLESPDPYRLAVRVTDQGVGISQAELKRVFRRFYRIPASVALRTKGSGLGLFIVRSIAKRHGGKAFAESAGPGQGSTFTILLPKVTA